MTQLMLPTERMDEDDAENHNNKSKLRSYDEVQYSVELQCAAQQ